MKNQTIGVEIEMTGITREKASKVISKFLNGEIKRSYDSYDTYKVTAPDKRIWKIMSDASIRTIKKEKGTLISADKSYSVELVTPILKYEDIETLQELIRKLRHAGAVSESKLKCGIHIHIGAKGHTPNTLKNLVNLIAAKEDLIYKSLEIDPARVKYCKKVNNHLIETINKKKPKNLKELADSWYSDYGVENRTRHYHTSRYHGLNLHSTFTKGTIEFRLFNGTMHAGKIRSYIVFCLAISHQALKQKSASAKRTHTDNEKYTFRCWLLRLGLIGDEFKNCRMHLMKSLDGDSAFRTPRIA
ncbi:amidoligase family protein [Clostridium botulinum]|uniref:amidoligase family protein n=1 Tax=Clostridium botulinum TaxID=1491 RepID=UPI0002DD9E36|nr:amidoligase family protein [Clostridium botulinum]KLU76024.1 amidoligase [Clostridium botulinum V891]KOA72903.1 amidoligase [Clostridium botulinum]KOA93036.1 amidoligase [Clostridium botulinum]KOC32191.1 amidoligase [Clostridium botulinum]MCD3203074.1 amidoligase [Clostridium botulinum C/D]